MPLTELIITSYVLGYGLLVSNFFISKNKIHENLSEICIFGFCLMLPISQIINFFFPLNNIFFYTTYGFSILLIYLNRKNLTTFKSWFLKLLIIFILFLPFKYVLKGNEDLFYHLPKVEFLNEFKIIFGIAHINSSLSFTNGWAHISSIFNFFNGASKNLYITSYVFYILIILTLYDYLKNSNSNNLRIYFVILISFLIVKFNRLQEFGNDYQSMLVMWLSLSLFLKYFFDESDNKKKLINKIIFYSFFAFMFRVYALFLAPMFLMFLFKKINILKIANKKLLIIILVSFAASSLTSFINSGCFFMPIEKTCLKKEQASWTYSGSVKNLNIHLRSFNTSYFEYDRINKNKISREDWIKKFNWFAYHIKSERFLLPLVKVILTIFSIFLLLAIKFKIKLKKINTKETLFLSLSFLSILFWLCFTPIIRAGGFTYLSFSLICFLIFIFEFKNIIDNKRIKYYFFIFSIILISLNLNRINKENKKYDTMNPFFFTYWYTLNSHYYEQYTNLNKILKSRHVNINLGGLKIIKKNNYWFVLANN